MKKKFYPLLLTVLTFIITLMLPASAFAAALSISPATGTLNKGCEYDLVVELDTQGAQTDGTDVILDYEPAKLTIVATNITNGKIYSDYPGNSIDSTLGKISVSGISSVSDAYTGKGTFATLHFKVASSAAGSTTLKFEFDPNDRTKTTDTNVVERGTIADVLSQVSDGNYTIGSGNCGAIGSSTSTSTSTNTSLTSTNSNSTLSYLPVGAPLSNSASNSSVPYSSLPNSGLLDNTIVITAVGTILVILGILGIALL